jgi:endo-1,4-beta-xylanase
MKNIRIVLLILIMMYACQAQQETLKEVFKDHYKIGTAVNRRQITRPDTTSLKFIVKHFNSITAENDLKWEKIHPAKDRYNFAPADSYVAFGEKNHMFIVGHVLLWHSQTPDWVYQDDKGKELSKDALLARIKEHIFTVAGRYKGKINGWDVINEAFLDDGSYRDSKYYRITEGEFLEKAFTWAHEAAPDAELYYNDFNMWKAGKVQAVVKMVENFKAKGVTIHGIGMQGHWGLDYPDMDELEKAIQAFAATGLKIHITELDMRVLPDPSGGSGAEVEKNYAFQEKFNPYKSGLPDSVQTMITERWLLFFKTFNKYKNHIERVTLWGIHDGFSWRNNWPVFGRTSYPLLFNRDFSPKPAVEAIIKATNQKDR